MEEREDRRDKVALTKTAVSFPSTLGRAPWVLVTNAPGFLLPMQTGRPRNVHYFGQAGVGAGLDSRASASVMKTSPYMGLFGVSSPPPLITIHLPTKFCLLPPPPQSWLAPWPLASCTQGQRKEVNCRSPRQKGQSWGSSAGVPMAKTRLLLPLLLFGAM